MILTENTEDLARRLRSYLPVGLLEVASFLMEITYDSRSCVEYSVYTRLWLRKVHLPLPRGFDLKFRDLIVDLILQHPTEIEIAKGVQTLQGEVSFRSGLEYVASQTVPLSSKLEELFSIDSLAKWIRLQLSLTMVTV